MLKFIWNQFKTRFGNLKMDSDTVGAGKRKLSPPKNSKYRVKKPRFIDKYEGDYYFDIKNGLRMVYPYVYEYHSTIKQRWYGLTLEQVYKKEFRAYREHIVDEKISRGEIKVNDQITAPDYVLKNGDNLTTVVHRHENAVMATPIQIVHEDDKFVVINKPSSIPVHPCGKYRLNSVLAIMYKEMERKEMHVVHRLDRLTSGLLILAKSSAMAKQVSLEICDRLVQKEYVCKVDGVFPEEEITCEQPIDRLCHKLGVHFVAPEGKPSATTFKRLMTDGKCSIVHCKPKTGRTHQIRIHLQYLGYPIINDILYNSDAFGSKRGKDADYEINDRSELIKRIYLAHPLDKWIDSEIDLAEVQSDIPNGDAQSTQANVQQRESQMMKALSDYYNISQDQIGPLIDNMKQNSILGLQDNAEMVDLIRSNVFDPSKLTVKSDCSECGLLFKAPSIDTMYICLHALRYKTPKWNFYAEPPSWAKMEANFDFKNLN